MKLEARHRRAAMRLADGAWHAERIAAEAGIKRTQLFYWTQDSEFAALVEEQRATLHAGIVKRGIADKQTRIDAEVERHQRLQQVIELRAERGQQELEANTGLTPGGLPDPNGKRFIPAEVATGMVVHQVKFSPSGMPIHEWVVDAGTSAEMRNLEKQVAQELGEWTERQDVSSGGAPLHFTIQIDRRGSDDGADSDGAEEQDARIF